MAEEPASIRKRKHYTLKKLIDTAVAVLCPGGVWNKPAPHDGKLVVIVDMPAESVDIPKSNR